MHGTQGTALICEIIRIWGTSDRGTPGSPSCCCKPGYSSHRDTQPLGSVYGCSFPGGLICACHPHVTSAITASELPPPTALYRGPGAAGASRRLPHAFSSAADSGNLPRALTHLNLQPPLCEESHTYTTDRTLLVASQ